MYLNIMALFPRVASMDWRITLDVFKWIDFEGKGDEMLILKNNIRCI